MKIFGLIGEKLGHSYSVPIHRLLGREEYRLIETPRDELNKLLSDPDIGGLNVTIPYKREVMKYCDEISDEAQTIGSVNTLVRDGTGRLTGHNTDKYGFEYMLSRAKIDVYGKKALILGSGGTSMTAAAALRGLGAIDVITISRSGDIKYDSLGKHCDAEIIVNTTPVGMYPNNLESIIDLSIFKRCTGVADVIYNPLRTALLLQAKRLGIPYTGGLPMLVAQAKASEELFFGKKLPDTLTESVIGSIRANFENIVLIGMPGCGKTVVGKRLSLLTGKKFIDIDEQIENKTGRTISDIIIKDGEKAFRSLETAEILKAGKESKAVIATGGGSVTRGENYFPLRQNGRIFHINRDPGFLEMTGRPLSKSREALGSMLETRLPLYRSFADKEIDGNGTADEAAKLIMEDFNENTDN